MSAPLSASNNKSAPEDAAPNDEPALEDAAPNDEPETGDYALPNSKGGASKGGAKKVDSESGHYIIPIGDPGGKHPADETTESTEETFDEHDFTGCKQCLLCVCSFVKAFSVALFVVSIALALCLAIYLYALHSTSPDKI